MQMRQWMASGATPLDMVRWIRKEYAGAKDDDTRRHLGLMMCAAMSAADSMSARHVAEKCAAMFSLPLLKGMSAGESAMIEMAAMHGCGDIDWTENFNPYFAKSCRLPSAASPAATVVKALTASDHTNILTVDRRNSVYFMRDSNGDSWLIAVNNCCSDMLVDEEPICGEAPLYFTESTHFVSPVWIVRQVANILDYILTRIGYPPIRISKRVIFQGSGANLINESDYRENGMWRDVDVITLDKTKVKPFPAPAIPVVDIDRYPSGNEQEVSAMLYLSVMATAEVIEGFDVRKHGDMTPEVIGELCRKSCVFPPDNWEILMEYDDEEQ